MQYSEQEQEDGTYSVIGLNGSVRSGFSKPEAISEAKRLNAGLDKIIEQA
ncbi:hypothetical protein [Psychromonas aquimarina]|nr:hypothetical protein [Psychromonas aquimarina]